MIRIRAGYGRGGMTNMTVAVGVQGRWDEIGKQAR